MGRKDSCYEGVFAIELSGLMVNWLVMVEGCNEKKWLLEFEREGSG